LRIALVGAGEVTEHKHLKAFREVRGASVVALADKDAARCARVADRYGIKRRLADARDCFSPEVADIIGILTPPGTHAELAVEALRQGQHVLVEKPLALSLADCDALAAAATRATGVAMTGFHMRWHRLLLRGREVIASGVLGHLESIRATWNSPRADEIAPPWKRTRVTGGGAIVELGVHLFDQWRFLTGAEVIDVFARARHGTRDDESATISASLSNGMLAEAIVSERTSHDIEIEVCGDQGRLRISCQRFDGIELFSRKETAGMVGPRLRGISRTVRELPRGLARMRTLGDYGDSYRGEWQHLVDCVRDGGMPGCSMLDGRAAVRVALAAAASASSGEAVRVDEAPPCLRAAR
jgi:predicted dehydrogenase